MQIIRNLLVLTGIFALTACTSGSVKDTLGLRRGKPDAFRVVSNQPLSMPPNFDLRPPRPGAERLGKQTIDKEAEKVVFENASVEYDNKQISKGEQSLLGLAGSSEANPDIKQILTEEELQTKEKEANKSMFDKVMSTAKNEEKANDPIVNAAKERERIAENKEEGKNITDGETPVVEQKKKSVLQRIFGK